MFVIYNRTPIFGENIDRQKSNVFGMKSLICIGSCSNFEFIEFIEKLVIISHI